MGGKPWSEEEGAKLKELYSQVSWDALVAAFPGRSRLGIERQARNLKLYRKRFAGEISGSEENANLLKKLEQENELLKQQLDAFVYREKFSSYTYQGAKARIGVISDTHLGSYYERLDLLRLAYRIFSDEGITAVYHVGDLVDGEKMYRGQEYEIRVHGADKQVDYFVNNYPQVSGIKTFFITGNHDLAFYRNSGYDIGTRVEQLRSDMEYLGPESADILVSNGKNEIKLRLVHPRSGNAYAISYQPQKYLEHLTGGEKPQIVLRGHNHKMEKLFYRNVFHFHAGCLQAQTPFMQGKAIDAHVGFWVLEFGIDKTNSVTRLKSEFFPHFEKSG